MSTDNLRIELDSQIFFGKRLLDGGKLVVITAFDSAFPLEMNNHGTLFSLKCVMPTHLHQTIDDVVKRVVVVVEQHDVPFVAEHNVGQNIFLGQCVGATHGDFSERNSRGAKIAGHACYRGLDAPSCPKSNLNDIWVFITKQPSHEKEFYPHRWPWSSVRIDRCVDA